MSVIFFDTDCELWYTQADELGAQVIKMPYTIDGVEYFYDLGRNTDFDDFFKRMRNGAQTSTSALNPAQYIEIFEPYFKKGEEILYISFSGQMSGTFGHLETALNQLNEKYPGVSFRRFDTKNICFGSGYQVYFAVKYFQTGKTIDEVIAFLEDFTNHIAIYFMVDDLMHLHRGGRLSKTSAIAGSILNIKPILTVDDVGKLTIAEKVKGEKKAVNYFMNMLEEKGSELDKYPIVVLDADNKEMKEKILAKVKEAYPDSEIWDYPIGPVIGTHCGPGTVGVIFHSKTR